MHFSRFDPDGNALTIVGNAHGDVMIEIDNDRIGPRRTHVAMLESDQLVLVAYEMLRLVQEAEGSDAVDAAIVALRPYADEADREAHQADVLGAMVGDES